jgi:hypothetical protein
MMKEGQRTDISNSFVSHIYPAVDFSFLPVYLIFRMDQVSILNSKKKSFIYRTFLSSTGARKPKMVLPADTRADPF